MKSNTRKFAVQILLFTAAAAALLLATNFYQQKQGEAIDPHNLSLSQRVELGGQTVRVSVADTPGAREVGLGDRTALAPDEGMMFVFPQDGKYGFWMKNMRFSIDILWLAANGRIVHLVEDVSPETYPEVFASEVSARYVLELPAGFVREYSVKVGDIVRP